MRPSQNMWRSAARVFAVATIAASIYSTDASTVVFFAATAMSLIEYAAEGGSCRVRALHRRRTQADV